MSETDPRKTDPEKIDCPFCQPSRVLLEGNLCVCLEDAFPVSPGHLLIVPRRHVTDYFEATAIEKRALWGMVDEARDYLMKKYQPAGFNLGVNAGVAAGQTVMHLHIHLIPRYAGDMDDPRGGVRGVIPGMQRYSPEGKDA